MSIHDVLGRYQGFMEEKNWRRAAEHAYALAVLYKNAGNNVFAAAYGNQTISLLELCPSDTYQDCAETDRIIEGVCTPDLMHTEVARDRLQRRSIIT